jgi:TPP-dependent pyruvate/acetoin dehydrogenase alpha subunit
MRGKGGSMHLTSEEHGVMGSYAIIGAHLPIACGAAWRAPIQEAEGRVGAASSATAPPTSARSTRR